MKKTHIILGILLFSSQILAQELSVVEMKTLEKEFASLVEQEKNRFQKERNLAQNAEKQNLQFEKLKKTIQETLNSAKLEKENKFFKKDFDQLTRQYETHLKKIEKETTKNNKIINNFKTLESVY